MYNHNGQPYSDEELKEKDGIEIYEAAITRQASTRVPKHQGRRVPAVPRPESAVKTPALLPMMRNFHFNGQPLVISVGRVAAS